jgi:hypothetical protein|nr:hypothetical protein [Kofleriaceae bacterium]
MRRLLGFLILAAACNGETGVLSLTLAEPAGSSLLQTDINKLRVTLTSPRQTVEADRTGSGFAIQFDVDATGADSQVIVQGFDGNSQLIAVGETPLLPISAINANLTIFVAPPLSIGGAPDSLVDPRRDLTAAATTSGAIFIGGISSSGFASASVESYNAFSHQEGLIGELPAVRTAPAVAVDQSGFVYVFAGSDGSGAPTSNLFRVEPSAGSAIITDITPDDASSFVRGAAIAMPLDSVDTFAISGTPAALLDVDAPSLTAVTTANVTNADGPAGAVVGSDDEVTAIFVGDSDPGSGLVRFHGSDVDLPAADPSVKRHGHAVTGAPNGDILVVGGIVDGSAGVPTADAIVIDAATGTSSIKPNLLATPRIGAAMTATSRYLIVAGGQSDDVACTTQSPCTLVGDAEVFDSTTLAPVTTIPLVVPRVNASAVPLPDDQVLIVGGTDANGAPIATIELFTPDLPADF